MDFAEEIRRIVRSPYPVSLKPLRDRTRNVEGLQLQIWAEGRPCHIPALVQSVLEGLECSPDALPLLEKLARASSIREEILRQKPVLLESLLRRASSSHHDSDLLASTCITLLGRKLPAEMAMPQSLSGFVNHVVGAVIESTSMSTLKQLHALLSHGDATLFDALPRDNVHNMVQQLLRALKQSETQSLHLLCLGVFAQVESARIALSEQSSFAKDGTPPNSGEKRHVLLGLDVISQFFDSSKAPKTVQLVVLKVILACSDGSTASTEDAIQDVRLATEILDAVDPAVRSSWVQGNPKSMQKMYERLLRLGVPRQLQLETLDFVGLLLRDRKLPDSVATAFEGILAQSMEDQALTPLAMKLPPRLVEGSLRGADAGLFKVVVLGILKVAMQGMHPTFRALQNLRISLDLLKALSATMQQSVTVQSALVDVLSTEELSTKLNAFIDSTVPEIPDANCDKTEVCLNTFVDIQREVHFSVCSFLLEAALGASTNRSFLSKEMYQKLLQRQHGLAMPRKAEHTPSRHQHQLIVQHLSLLEQASTPEQHNNNVHWRERLAAELSRDSTAKNEAIIRHFSVICRDLEVRCDNAEAPLREEQAKTAALTAELLGAQSALAEMELEAAELRTRSDDAQQARERIEADIQGLNAQLHASDEEVWELRQQLEELSCTMHTRMISATESAKEREMEHLALLALKDEAINEMREKVNYMEGLLDRQQAELKEAEEVNLKMQVEHLALLAQKEKTMDEMREKTNTMEELLDCRQAQLVETKEVSVRVQMEHLAQIAQKDERINEMLEKTDTLEELLERQQGQLEEAKAVNVKAQQSIGELEDRLRDQARDAQQHQQAMEKEQQEKTAKLLAVEHSLNEDIETLKQEAHTSKGELAALTARYEKLEVLGRKQVSDLQTALETSTKEAASREAHLQRSHQSDLAKLESKIRLERSTALQQAKRAKSRIAELEKQNERLEREKQAKAKEFAEAQDLSRRLMAVMGASAGKMTQPAPETDNPNLNESFSDLQLEEGSQPELDDFDSTQDLPEDAETSGARDGSVSPAALEDAPAPKRHRPGKAPRTPFFERGPITGTMTNTRRQVLQESTVVNQLRRTSFMKAPPMQGRTVSPSKATAPRDQMMLDGIEFDDDGSIFTSAQRDPHTSLDGDASEEEAGR